LGRLLRGPCTRARDHATRRDSRCGTFADTGRGHARAPSTGADQEDPWSQIRPQGGVPHRAARGRISGAPPLRRGRDVAGRILHSSVATPFAKVRTNTHGRCGEHVQGSVGCGCRPATPGGMLALNFGSDFRGCYARKAAASHRGHHGCSCRRPTALGHCRNGPPIRGLVGQKG
jgi:hypothetical protein